MLSGFRDIYCYIICKFFSGSVNDNHDVLTEFEKKGASPYGISPSILRKMILGVYTDFGIFTAL
jgi:hypothetical protein